MIKNCARSAPRDLLKQFFRPRREDLKKPFSFLLALDGDGLECVFRGSAGGFLVEHDVVHVPTRFEYLLFEPFHDGGAVILLDLGVLVS